MHTREIVLFTREIVGTYMRAILSQFFSSVIHAILGVANCKIVATFLRAILMHYVRLLVGRRGDLTCEFFNKNILTVTVFH
jgi:hypothetical protein